MIELTLNLILPLLIAIVLSSFVSWFISSMRYKKKYKEKEDALSAIIFERDNMIDKIEKKSYTQNITNVSLESTLHSLKEELAEKKSLSIMLQMKLEEIKTSTNIELEKENSYLESKLLKLSQMDVRRIQEVKDFESVLIKAEDKIEEHEKKLKFYLKKINDFEKDLKLYKATRDEVEFIISKDQFIKIEEQLTMYQKEIVDLKNKNDELIMRIVKNLKEEKIGQEKSDDGTVVKVFRETYKKITKA